jgi:hypothetical protein
MMVTAYVDESGIHQGSLVVVMAGYFAVLEEWERFEVDWNEALRQAGVSTFHATDCRHGYGFFRDMPREKRAELYKTMVQIVTSHHLIGTSSSTLLHDYENVMSDIPKPMFFKPYVLCFQHVLFDLYDCFVQSYIDHNEELSVVCGLQKDFGFEAHQLFRYVRIEAQAHSNYFERLNSITFVAENKAPLQAADLLAHETYLELLRRGDPTSDHPVRKSFLELSKRGLEGHILDHRSLLELKRQFLTNPDWWMIEGRDHV